MTRLLVFIAALALLLPGSAHADNFLSPAPPPASAAPSAEDTAKQALQYYDRCQKLMFPGASDDARQDFCACSADRVSRSMTPDELATLATGVGPPVDTKKLAVKVVAPCLAEPVREMEYKLCMRLTSNAHYFKTIDAYTANCRCVSQAVAPYIQKYGEDLMAYLVVRMPGSEQDPAAAIMNDPTFQNELDKQRTKCMNSYAYQ